MLAYVEQVEVRNDFNPATNANMVANLGTCMVALRHQKYKEGRKMDVDVLNDYLQEMKALINDNKYKQALELVANFVKHVETLPREAGY